MGVISNIYEEESDIRSPVSESYTSDCVIVMESLFERLSPSAPVSGCDQGPGTIYVCDTDYSAGRSNSWPSGGGRRRGRRVTYPSHPHLYCKHDCVHNCGHPEPDTGQESGQISKSGETTDIRGQYIYTKCGYGDYWNKNRMLRMTRRFILLLLLASCGGYILTSGIGRDSSSDLAEIVESPSLKDIHLEPVPISELKRQLQHTKNYYEFFRIFLSKKDVSDEVIDEYVNARTIQKIARDYDEYEDEVMMGDEEQDRLDEELTEAMYHNEEMATSPLGECKTPQPEIVKVFDEENKNRMYLPECTIVHRCRNVSGCCGSSNLECGPLKIQVIQRAFMVISIFDDKKGIPGEDMVQRKMFINHTECGCQEKRLPLPSCDKYKCPFPFTMMRKGVECTCDCQEFTNEDNYLCQGIKDGTIPLTETDLACIKSKTCLMPTCTSGTLHVQSGHCPQIDEEEINFHEFELGRSRNQIINPFSNRKRELSLKERELVEDEDNEREGEINELGNVAGIKAEGRKTVIPEEYSVEYKERSDVDLQVEHEVQTRQPLISDLNISDETVESSHETQTEKSVTSGSKPEVVTESAQLRRSEFSAESQSTPPNVARNNERNTRGETQNKISESVRDSNIRENSNNFKRVKTRKHHRKGGRLHRKEMRHDSDIQS